MTHPMILLAVAALALAATRLVPGRAGNISMPEVVHLDAGISTYRAAGEFRIGTQVVDAPLQQTAAQALDIMTFQVSQAGYARCIAAAACPDIPTKGSPTQAQTGVSYTDATAYADWFSAETGQHWRLPTDAEWLRAAGNRAQDDGLAVDADAIAAAVADGSDPSLRWLASYRREAEIRGEADFLPHPLGHFGLNDLGLADIAGNIWEWTETCFQNGSLSRDGRSVVSATDHCGVRAVQGKHRAFVIDFIRDTRSGGCAAGVPPDYLGFRLVRDPS